MRRTSLTFPSMPFLYPLFGDVVVECPALWASGSEPAALIRLFCIEDIMNVATFARVAKVQCWTTSCNIQCPTAKSFSQPV